ncbi:uncharacterized protein LOC117169296 [Belonocnema kinseyi]|uniref:uncharacterized protein LOC117169296 n=1 Tax=Belonocnema kinseyi TaxID=2817044 RepID=UPI00143D27B4|nr:uncharacterized protein LOC117169296 [Belonocnema kinseyi]
MTEKITVEKLPHHEQQELCRTRIPYRQGKKLTAVKVYTINDESTHLLVCGVPKLQLNKEVKKLFSPYGEIKKLCLLPDYPSEEFTEAFHVHYGRIQSARIAKRFVDCKNFYGGLLHVCYAPELESISETRAKLIQRNKDVTVRIKRHKLDPTNPEIDQFVEQEQYHRKKKTPALPLTQERLDAHYPNESLGNGMSQVKEPSLPQEFCSASTSSGIQYNNIIRPSNIIKPSPELLQAPYQPYETIIRTANSRKLKRKNYKGQSVDQGPKVRVIRPQLIDTRNIARRVEPEKKVFINAKKVESGINIKILPRTETKKRIVIKDPSVTQLVRPSADLKTSIQVAKDQIRQAMQKSTEA